MKNKKSSIEKLVPFTEVVRLKRTKTEPDNRKIRTPNYDRSNGKVRLKTFSQIMSES